MAASKDHSACIFAEVKFTGPTKSMDSCHCQIYEGTRAGKKLRRNKSFCAPGTDKLAPVLLACPTAIVCQLRAGALRAHHDKGESASEGLQAQRKLFAFV